MARKSVHDTWQVKGSVHGRYHDALLYIREATIDRISQAPFVVPGRVRNIIVWNGDLLQPVVDIHLLAAQLSFPSGMQPRIYKHYHLPSLAK